MTAGCRGLLCDLDGTLADSLPVLIGVYERFVTAHGGTPSSDEFERLNGVPIEQVVEMLSHAHGWSDRPEELVDRYERAIDECYHEAPTRDGARELLTAARRGGWRCAVVTSGRSGRARSWLRSHGLDDLVDTVVGSDDVRRGKPDPEPYLLALARMNADPASSIAVEDSMPGVASALSAGLRTCFLADGMTHESTGAIAVDGLWQVVDALTDPSG